MTLYKLYKKKYILKNYRLTNFVRKKETEFVCFLHYL
jgi:hypothetical protein